MTQPSRQHTIATAMHASEITCLIVDDHEVVREGLRLSLSRAPHIRVIGEASDGASAVALAERRRPERRDHGRADARDGRARGDEGAHREACPRRRRADLHRVQRAVAARPRARVGREGLHPQGGAARDAPARDREGRRRRGLRRPGADARVPDRQGPGRHAHRRASGRSSSCSPTGCRTPTSRQSSSSARRRSRATCATSSRSSRPTRARTRSRSRCATRSSTDADPGSERGRARADERAAPRRAARSTAEQDERRRHRALPPRRAGAVARRDRADARRGVARDRGRASSTRRSEMLANALDRTATTIRDAARPLVQPRAGRPARPGLRAGGARARRAGRARRTSSRSTLDVDGAEGLGEQAQVALYQIIREALDQARSGAGRRRTSSVSVERTDDGGVEAPIDDDGAGERRRERQMLDERARTLDGDVALEQPRGTRSVTAARAPARIDAEVARRGAAACSARSAVGDAAQATATSRAPGRHVDGARARISDVV